MLPTIIAVLLALIIPAMAYIPYKHPFKNQQGQTTKWARFFGWLVVLSFLLGAYLACDTFKATGENKTQQTTLTNKIATLNVNIRKLGDKIDSVGFKIDRKSGKLIQKKTKIIPIKTIIKYTGSNNAIELKQNQLASIFNEVEMYVKKDTGIKRLTIYKEDYSNAPYVTAQIRDYFADKGYKAKILPLAFGGMSTNNETIEGAKVTAHSKYGIWIRVGYCK